MNESTQIICPNCGHAFSVEAVLAHQLEEELKKKFENEKAQLLKDINSQKESLKEKEKNLETLRLQQEEIILERLEEQKSILRNQLLEEVQAEHQKEIKSLQDEIIERKNENQKLKDKEIELERLKRKFDERDKELQLEYEKKLNAKRAEIEEVISKREQEKNQMLLMEKDKKLEDLKKQIKEMERKAEQGSMQLQGEVQELAIEDILTDMFKYDEISEVPKGKKGADAIHIVKNNSLDSCGKIIYESKRTKSFSNSWIEKLKVDRLREKADVAVLITKVLPEGINSVGVIEDIWICDFNSFPGLALALREGLINVNRALASQINRGDKMNMLYNYLTSNEFKLQIESIIEGFMNLKDSIAKERIAMEKLWKEREKQIEKVLLNTTNFYGAIKGIAGKAIPSVPLLELPSGER